MARYPAKVNLYFSLEFRVHENGRHQYRFDHRDRDDGVINLAYFVGSKRVGVHHRVGPKVRSDAGNTIRGGQFRQLPSATSHGIAVQSPCFRPVAC